MCLHSVPRNVFSHIQQYIYCTHKRKRANMSAPNYSSQAACSGQCPVWPAQEARKEKLGLIYNLSFAGQYSNAGCVFSQLAIFQLHPN